MTEAKRYWIADGDGTKALVEGVEERDRWVRVHGWAESGEPTGQEFVWVRNENPELGASRLNWQAATDPAWAARGWTPGPPLEPVNNATAHWVHATETTAGEPKSSQPKSSTSSKSATGGDKSKE